MPLPLNPVVTNVMIDKVVSEKKHDKDKWNNAKRDLLLRRFGLRVVDNPIVNPDKKQE